MKLEDYEDTLTEGEEIGYGNCKQDFLNALRELQGQTLTAEIINQLEERM